MATEGAALSHLRDAYYILNHDLVSIDLQDLKDEIDANSKSLDAATKVAPVVAKLAQTMLMFSTAVESANDMTVHAMKAAKAMLTLVVLLMIVVLATVIYVMVMIIRKRYYKEGADISTLVPLLGKSVLSGLAFVAFMLTWLIMLVAHGKDLNHNRDVLKVGYWRVHNLVGGAYAMRFEAASQQGTLPDFVKNQYSNGGSTLIPGPDCESDREEGDPVDVSCNQQIDPCGVTSPTLIQVIMNSCQYEISNMLKELQLIKTEGVDSYDRSALWKAITRGITDVRKTVSISADANTSTPTSPADPLQANAAQAVVDSQIVPLLQTSDMRLEATHLEDNSASVVPAPMTRNPLLATKFNHMTSEILAVIQALKYDLSVDEYRIYLDASMAKYYDASYPWIRFDLMSVLDKVQQAADSRPALVANLYVDSATLLARVKDMGPSAWSELVFNIDVTKEAVRTFLGKFKLPSQAPSAGLKITKMMVIVLTLAGFLVLFMYIIDIITRQFATSLNSQVAARSIVIAACMYALATVTVHAMVNRMQYRSGHNWDSIRRNGQTLAYSLEMTEETAVHIQGSQNLVAADAQKYIDAAVASVHAYDDCNSVTNGASAMPFPTMDVVMYCFVVVVVMSSALYGIDTLNPRDKVAKIRTLMRLKERVLNGEVPGGMVKQLECCMPNKSVWHILTWLSVVILFCLNIYVMSNVQTTNDNYKRSLMLLVNCV